MTSIQTDADDFHAMLAAPKGAITWRQFLGMSPVERKRLILTRCHPRRRREALSLVHYAERPLDRKFWAWEWRDLIPGRVSDLSPRMQMRDRVDSILHRRREKEVPHAHKITRRVIRETLIRLQRRKIELIRECRDRPRTAFIDRSGQGGLTGYGGVVDFSAGDLAVVERSMSGLRTLDALPGDWVAAIENRKLPLNEAICDALGWMHLVVIEHEGLFVRWSDSCRFGTVR